jgi:hypothetical protein
VPDDEGYALVRTYEIDDDLLPEYGVPGEQRLAWTKTLEAMQDAIIQEEGPRFMRSVRKSHESEHGLEQPLSATVSRSGDTLRICASKDGEPLTQEDHTQLQLLESQVKHQSDSVTLNSSIVLDGHRDALETPPQGHSKGRSTHDLHPGRGRGLTR